MGTPDFAATALKALIGAGHEIAAVYSQPPRPAGRGQALRQSPVQALAASQGLTVRTPISLKTAEAREEFAAFTADAAVVAAYGLILPQAILDMPRLGCLNIHASLLPRWRGAAPIQRAILAGDRESGISIMQMDAGLDTGAVLLEKRIAIGLSTAGDLHDRLADLGARAILDALEGVAAGSLEAKPQPETGVSYAAKLTSGEARLDWRKSAGELARAVRAFNPAPGAWALLPDEERIKVLEAEAKPGRGRPGTILDDRLTVACGEGALRLSLVQRAGKRAMDAEAMLRGMDIQPGAILP
jgi:methionyl-tRNA formyltransferase